MNGTQGYEVGQPVKLIWRTRGGWVVRIPAIIEMIRKDGRIAVSAYYAGNRRTYIVDATDLERKP